MNQPSQFDNQTTAPQQHRRPSVWPALLAFLLIGAIYMVVPEQLPIGPSWLLLAVIIAFLIPVSVTRWRGKLHITRRLGFAILTIVTACVAASAAFLLLHLTSGTVRAPTLLRDAALIWVANILTFAIWYWEIDGGGPAQRHHDGYHSTDFAFPQITLEHSPQTWCPHFVDYLFLAFNTSTAFSPTDTMVLSRRAKLLMMTQALISLVALGVLVARAINTL